MPIAVTRLIRNSVLVRRSWLTDSRVAERAHELIMVRDGHSSNVHNLFNLAPVSSDVQTARPWGVIGWGRPWGLHGIIMHVAKDLATRVRHWKLQPLKRVNKTHIRTALNAFCFVRKTPDRGAGSLAVS